MFLISYSYIWKLLPKHGKHCLRVFKMSLDAHDFWGKKSLVKNIFFFLPEPILRAQTKCPRICLETGEKTKNKNTRSFLKGLQQATLGAQFKNMFMY